MMEKYAKYDSKVWHFWGYNKHLNHSYLAYFTIKQGILTNLRRHPYELRETSSQGKRLS